MGKTTTEGLFKAENLLLAASAQAKSIITEMDDVRSYLHGANSEIERLEQDLIHMQHRIDQLQKNLPDVANDLEFLLDLSARTGHGWMYYLSLNFDVDFATTMSKVRANNTGGKQQ